MKVCGNICTANLTPFGLNVLEVPHCKTQKQRRKSLACARDAGYFAPRYRSDEFDRRVLFQSCSYGNCFGITFPLCSAQRPHSPNCFDDNSSKCLLRQRLSALPFRYPMERHSQTHRLLCSSYAVLVMNFESSQNSSLTPKYRSKRLALRASNIQRKLVCTSLDQLLVTV